MAKRHNNPVHCLTRAEQKDLAFRIFENLWGSIRAARYAEVVLKQQEMVVRR